MIEHVEHPFEPVFSPQSRVLILGSLPSVRSRAEGFYYGLIPTTYEDGVLRFRVGDENNPACYYLIVAD